VRSQCAAVWAKHCGVQCFFRRYSHSDGQKIPLLLRQREFIILKNRQLTHSCLIHMSPFFILAPYFFKIYFNIILSFMLRFPIWCLLFMFSQLQIGINFLSLYARYRPHQSHLPWLNHRKHITFWYKRWNDPATRHGGTWRERRYSSYSFLTSALDGGEWSASRPGRALPPGKGSPVHIVQETGWAPEPVWTQRLEEKSSASVGDRTPVVQPVVRHYTDWATAAPVTF
jgi:hypothetical protein